jgi:hypothetical protein
MNIKRYWPHLAAISAFLVILMVFLNPIVFGGKQIKQHDVEVYRGASKEIADFRSTHKGEEPLWTNSMFGGMPAYQISVLYPGNWISSMQTAFIKFFTVPFGGLLLIMIGFYILLLALDVNPWISIGAAIAVGLASYNVIILQAGHNTKTFAIAYMAPVLAGILLTMRGKFLIGGVLTTVALAFEITSNHLQITYYLALLCVLIVIGETIRLIREKQLLQLMKSAAILVVAIVLSIIPNIGSLYFTNEYGKETTRGRSELTIDAKEDNKTADGLSIAYATQWSYGVGETATLLIPDFNGGASEAMGKYAKSAIKKADTRYQENLSYFPAYFGDQPMTSGPVYVGAIFCFLFLLGILLVKDPIKWWLLAGTLLSITFSWGSNAADLTEFLFHNFPGFNKFRAVSMILVVAGITIPLLGMLAIRDIMKDPTLLRNNMRALWIALGVTGGFAFLVAVTPTSVVTAVKDSEAQEVREGFKKQGLAGEQAEEMISDLEVVRSSMVSSDAWRSFFFIAIAGGLLFFYTRSPFNGYILAGAFFLLLTADMFTVASRFLSQKKDHYEKRSSSTPPYAATQSDEIILRDKDPDYRVLNLSVSTWSDASTSYYHKSIGGYHGAKLKRIQELYEQAMQPDISDFASQVNKAQSDSAIQVALAPQATLNMLNTRYIIFNKDGGVVRNSHACGNAWFVKATRVVANADSEIVAVRNFDPLKTAIIDKRFAQQLNGFNFKFDSTATIRLTSYKANQMIYESNSVVEQVAIFSEIYYPYGWNVYIDGKPSEHFRADYVLRGMRIPAGKHKIEFKFEPSFYTKGNTIARIGSVFLLLAIAGAIFTELRNRKKNVVAVD